MLTNKLLRRVELEHEPGAWIEVRAPSFAIMREVWHDGDINELLALQRCVTAWSYEEPATPENILELDGLTVQAVLGAIYELIPRAAEKHPDGAAPGA